MKIEIENTLIRDVCFVHPQVFRDERGFFMEVFRRDVWREAGLDLDIVQENHSQSSKNVLRGLHFQWAPPMGKLMRVTRGQAFLVAVDIRKSSPTLGKWVGRVLDGDVPQFFYAPAGCARGFVVLSDIAEIQYLTTGTYNGAAESGILWNDPDIGIAWPVNNPILSKKDERQMRIREWLNTAVSDNFV